MKHVLITGACGGIGRAVVETLLENGYYVFGADLRDDGFSHANYSFFNTDITDTANVKRTFGQIAEVTDGLDGVINTAGIVFFGSLVEEDADHMQKVLDVNLSGMARVNNIFFPLVERAKGRYVNFSSEYGKFCSLPFHGYYTASKHAVESYNDSLRREMNYLGIKVIAIRPGAVNTPMTKGTVPNFERIIGTTTHYEKTYKKLYPLMVGATKHPTPADHIAKKVYEAMSVKRPKKYYNIRQDIRVKLLSLLPPSLTDFVFKRFF